MRTVQPLLSPVEVESLRWVYESLGPTPGDGNLCSFRTSDCTDRGYRSAVHSAVAAELAGPLARLGLPETMPLVEAGFVMGWPGAHSGEGIRLVDEAAGALTGLVALDEVRAANGGWWVLPGSPHPPGGSLDADVVGALAREDARSIEVDRGQVLLVAGGLRMFSLPNRIDKPRLAATFTVRVTDGDAATTLEALVGSWSSDGSPSRPVGRARPAEPPNALQARCCGCGVGLSGPVHPWAWEPLRKCTHCEQRLDSFSWQPPTPLPGAAAHLSFCSRPDVEIWDRAHETSSAEPLGRPPAAEPALCDAALDAALERDGYVLVPGRRVDPGRAAGLRAAFERLRGADGTGFLNDFNDRDLTYRRRAAELVADVLDPLAHELFVDHVPFIRPFLCKFPGEGSYFKPHRDWMYVDERAGHRSFVVFVALEDITEDNGLLELIPGSHRLDTMLRGTFLEAPWVRRTDQLSPRMEPFPLRRGEVLIWDHAIVHGSFPNLTDLPRLGAALWMAPAGAPLVHYRRLDESTAWRHDVDHDFFATQNPYRLMLHAPPEPVTEVTAIGGAWRTEEQLTAALDRCDPAREASP